MQTSGDPGRQAGNRKKIQMERLPKENYYQPTLATLAPAKKPDFPPSSSSGSETVMTADDRAHSANQVSDGRVNAGKYRTLRRHAREYHNQRNITEGGCFYFSPKSREEDLLVSGPDSWAPGPTVLGRLSRAQIAKSHWIEGRQLSPAQLGPGAQLSGAQFD